jgi:hypothetical protein
VPAPPVTVRQIVLRQQQGPAARQQIARAKTAEDPAPQVLRGRPLVAWAVRRFLWHHGPDGKGGSVAEVAFGKEAGEIDDIVRAGHGGTNLANRPKWMPAFSTIDLPDADLAAIKTFLNAR